MKTIQSPDGISLLIENLWLRHKTGMQRRPANVYMVELLPLSDEEIDEIRRKARENSRPNDEPEDLYGAWI